MPEIQERIVFSSILDVRRNLKRFGRLCHQIFLNDIPERSGFRQTSFVFPTHFKVSLLILVFLAHQHKNEGKRKVRCRVECAMSCFLDHSRQLRVEKYHRKTFVFSTFGCRTFLATILFDETQSNGICEVVELWEFLFSPLMCSICAPIPHTPPPLDIPHTPPLNHHRLRRFLFRVAGAAASPWIIKG